MSRLRALVLVGGVLAALPAPAAGAHHSFAMFEQDKTVTITGTLADFSWTNPHIWFDLMVADENGKHGEMGDRGRQPRDLDARRLAL